MVTNSHKATYRRIIDSATKGFLSHGYHGYSMQSCAEAVGLEKGSLYHYMDSKIDLAHRVMQTLLEDSKQSICTNQWPFTLRNGLTLAVLPMRLWVANDDALQGRIRAYYTDWYFAFINRTFDGCNVDEDTLYPAGHRDFLRWLGFWFAQQMVFEPGKGG